MSTNEMVAGLLERIQLLLRARHPLVQRNKIKRRVASSIHPLLTYRQVNSAAFALESDGGARRFIHDGRYVVSAGRGGNVPNGPRARAHRPARHPDGQLRVSE